MRVLLTEGCLLKENIIYNNRGNQNFLNKKRWFRSKAAWGTPYFCAGYSLWGLHTGLIASLPMQETQFLVWMGAMGLAPTSPVNVVLADTQEAVNNVSCWLFHGAVVRPVGGPKVQSS